MIEIRSHEPGDYTVTDRATGDVLFDHINVFNLTEHYVAQAERAITEALANADKGNQALLYDI